MRMHLILLMICLVALTGCSDSSGGKAGNSADGGAPANSTAIEDLGPGAQLTDEQKLKIAAEVIEGKRPESDLEKHGITLGKVKTGEEAKKQLLADLEKDSGNNGAPPPLPPPPAPPAPKQKIQSEYEIAEVFASLRSKILELKAEDVGLKDVDKTTVVAVLMETGHAKAVVTLVAVTDGTTSLYFSNGGGIIGAGEHDAVKKVSKALVQNAAEFLSKASASKSFPLPKKGRVRFYLVTGGGVFTVEASEDDLGNKRHPFSPLFHKGHELIAAIRQNTPEK